MEPVIFATSPSENLLFEVLGDPSLALFYVFHRSGFLQYLQRFFVGFVALLVHLGSPNRTFLGTLGVQIRGN